MSNALLIVGIVVDVIIAAVLLIAAMKPPTFRVARSAISMRRRSASFRNIGEGRMEILESTPSRTVIKLDFYKPFEAYNIAEFRLEPRGEATRVTWAMHGPNRFIGKVMSTFISMEDVRRRVRARPRKHEGDRRDPGIDTIAAC